MCFEKLLSNKITKNFLLSLIIGIFVTSGLTCYSDKAMADITGSVVRLHILANSDSESDQQLKIKVRDDVIEYLQPLLENAQSTEDTKNIIRENIKNIEDIAKISIKKHGCTYDATAVFGNFEFPEKEYEDTVFPSGNYDALRIIIGNGNGHNWWCVLYPQLCFSTSINGTMSDENKDKLKNVLTDDEYDMITKDGVNFKLKIVGMFSN